MIRVVLMFIALGGVNNGVFCLGEDVILSFGNFSSSVKDHVQREVILPPSSSIKIIVTDMPSQISFVIIQAHSFLYKVILSFDPILAPENHVNGTNIGLFYHNNGPAVFYLKNTEKINVSALLAAVPYTKESPIPGGCNLESPIAIKPYLGLSLSSAMVTVDGSPAANLNEYDNCDINPFAYIMFYKYISERDFSVRSYFDAIQSMLTYSRVLNNSYVAPEPAEGPPLRRIFNKYSGTGTVYALIAFNKYGNGAVYTPTFSYGCDNLFDDTPCELLSSPLLKIQFALLISISAFICFAGHRYFLSELFFMGALAGGLISHILLLLQASFSGDLVLMSTGIGIVVGAIWVCIWWFISSPILSVTLPFLVNGFFMSATMFFYFMYYFSILQSDVNYWLGFLILMFMIVLLSTANPVKFNMLACSFVGAFGIILPLDYYVGSSLKYIIVNVVRRATVEGFNLASTKPPFQLADAVLGVMWLICVIGGYRTQSKLSVNRSPFPPACSILREQTPETTPILANARVPNYGA